MRVYLPSTLAGLAVIHGAGGLDQGDHEGYAVSPRLREWYVEGDLEELEFAALTQAAEASLRALATDTSAPRRRVVIAADVPDAAVTNEAVGPRARVRIAGPVPLSVIAAVHVDEPDAEPTIAAAVRALDAAASGDDDARFAVEEAAGFDLLWFAAQEIPDLLG